MDHWILLYRSGGLKTIAAIAGRRLRHRHRKLEQLPGKGLALGVDVEAGDPASAEAVLQQEIEGMDPRKLPASDPPDPLLIFS
jgi:hypothetical protein